MTLLFSFLSLPNVSLIILCCFEILVLMPSAKSLASSTPLITFVWKSWSLSKLSPSFFSSDIISYNSLFNELIAESYSSIILPNLACIAIASLNLAESLPVAFKTVW